jgi:hypothetical protein
MFCVQMQNRKIPKNSICQKKKESEDGFLPGSIFAAASVFCVVDRLRQFFSSFADQRQSILPSHTWSIVMHLNEEIEFSSKILVFDLKCLKMNFLLSHHFHLLSVNICASAQLFKIKVFFHFLFKKNRFK